VEKFLDEFPIGKNYMWAVEMIGDDNIIAWEKIFALIESIFLFFFIFTEMVVNGDFEGLNR